MRALGWALLYAGVAAHLREEHSDPLGCHAFVGTAGYFSTTHRRWQEVTPAHRIAFDVVLEALSPTVSLPTEAA